MALHAKCAKPLPPKVCGFARLGFPMENLLHRQFASECRSRCTLPGSRRLRTSPAGLVAEVQVRARIGRACGESESGLLRTRHETGSLRGGPYGSPLVCMWLSWRWPRGQGARGRKLLGDWHQIGFSCGHLFGVWYGRRKGRCHVRKRGRRLQLACEAGRARQGGAASRVTLRTSGAGHQLRRGNVGSRNHQAMVACRRFCGTRAVRSSHDSGECRQAHVQRTGTWRAKRVA